MKQKYIYYRDIPPIDMIQHLFGLFQQDPRHGSVAIYLQEDVLQAFKGAFPMPDGMKRIEDWQCDFMPSLFERGYEPRPY